MTTHVVILGGGQIGSAAYNILSNISRFISESPPSEPYSVFAGLRVTLLDLNAAAPHRIDVAGQSVEDLTGVLTQLLATHVINALPFSLNVKVATAALHAGCHYIDFTEDDAAADAVQQLYAAERPDLLCATKCGLAPGFINYVGMELVSAFKHPESLMVCVGALPRSVSFSAAEPWKSYHRSWSVDGLVNEYIRPCRVKRNGTEHLVHALSDRQTLVLDGLTYEIANTSGGIGSLTKDLRGVPNVCYKTIRYPGHYDYVEEAVRRLHGDFAALKAEFEKMFPFSRNDVVVAYAEATGRDDSGGVTVSQTYQGKFYGHHGLSAIQLTTAGGALAVLELALKGKLSGVVRHKDVKFSELSETLVYAITYNWRD